MQNNLGFNVSSFAMKQLLLALEDIFIIASSFQGESWLWKTHDERPELRANFQPKSIRAMGNCSWEICSMSPCSASSKKKLDQKGFYFTTSPRDIAF